MRAYDFNYCLDKIRSGETKWLENIYNEYYEKMVLKAWFKIRNIHAAEDVASDFIKHILQNAKDIEYIEFPDAWVYSAIHNKSVSYIRKNSRADYIEDIKEDRFAHRVNYDLYCAFTNAFKDLTEFEQELVLLHFLYGLKYKEISKMIARPVGTIKSDISKIKSKLNDLKEFLR